MAVKSNSELAAFFETGDQPSEAEFGHLVDTILPPAVTLADTTGTVALTAATHAYRNLYIGATATSGGLTGDLKLTLPSTIVTDEWYHIIFFGELDAADTHDLKIETGTLNSHFFQGMLTHHDTSNDNSGGALNVPVHGNGTSNDSIDVLLAAGCDIWIQAKSSTIWYVWGNVTGATPVTIEDSLS